MPNILMDEILHAAISEHVNECYAITATAPPTGDLYAIWWRIGGDPSIYLDNENPQVDHAIVQVDVWGNDALRVKHAMQTIKVALHNNNELCIHPVGNWRENYDAEMQLFCASQDFSVRF